MAETQGRGQLFGYCDPNIGADQTMKKTFLDFLKDTSGATAIEYGLIAAGISLAIISAVNGLGTSLNTRFADVNSSLK